MVNKKVNCIYCQDGILYPGTICLYCYKNKHIDCAFKTVQHKLGEQNEMV